MLVFSQLAFKPIFYFVLSKFMGQHQTFTIKLVVCTIKHFLRIAFITVVFHGINICQNSSESVSIIFQKFTMLSILQMSCLQNLASKRYIKRQKKYYKNAK